MFLKTSSQPLRQQASCSVFYALRARLICLHRPLLLPRSPAVNLGNVRCFFLCDRLVTALVVSFRPWLVVLNEKGYWKNSGEWAGKAESTMEGRPKKEEANKKEKAPRKEVHLVPYDVTGSITGRFFFLFFFFPHLRPLCHGHRSKLSSFLFPADSRTSLHVSPKS